MNVLFLCTGNSARSIMAEVILNDIGGERFAAYSAGSQPTGTVNPAAERQLRFRGHRHNGLESKSWTRFAGEGAVPFDAVITVCDSAAGEACPVWPGSPVTAHWGVADPAAVNGDDTEIDTAFAQAYDRLLQRIVMLVKMSESALAPENLRRSLQAIAVSSASSDNGRS